MAVRAKLGFIPQPSLRAMMLKERRIKGNVEAELVLHAMIEYPHYERALIVTGDGDFYCLVSRGFHE